MMNKDDFQAFRDVIGGLAEIYRRQLSTAAIGLYWRLLWRWPIEDVKRAAEYLALNCAFMPMPKDFHDLRRAGRPTPGEAWETARAHATPPGWRAPPPCEDPQINAVVRMIGGSSAIAMYPADKLAFLERQFCEHYRDLEDAEDVRRSVPEIARSNYRLGATLPDGQIAAPLQRAAARGRKGSYKSISGYLDAQYAL
jgi:hypothetical protein